MVCLGNICRSPMAEGLLRHKAKAAGIPLEIDSCGTTNYHTDEAPDPRAQATMLSHGIDISGLKARQIDPSDFEEFDVIFAMDKSNSKNASQLAVNEDQLSKLKLFLSNNVSSGIHEVPDPYFGGDKGFEDVYELLNNACDAFLESIR